MYQSLFLLLSVVACFNCNLGGKDMNKFYDKDGITIYNDDNLEVLRSLPDKSINLIYCDVLYNSGKKFDDYDDNLGSPTEAVEWYRPRFEEMKRVLTDNGSIFIHCNWRLDSYLRVLMDEIFGINNFRNRIYRKHSRLRGFYRNFDSQMDIILYYVKDTKDFIFNEYFQGFSHNHLYPLFENGYLKGRSENRIVENSVIEGGCLVSGEGQVEISLADFNKHWLVSPDEFNMMCESGVVRVISGLPYRCSKKKVLGNLWDEDFMLDPYSRTDTAESYDTPKPEAVLNRIISICSNPGDVVGDFFLGGGTTAVVAKKLGRRGIFCDISRKACEVSIRKLENVKK